MRVLVASKFWYRRGGLERVMFDEIEWLEAAGHRVAHFSTRHPENESSPYEEYFADYIELGAGAKRSRTQSALAVVRMFHNRQAADRFRRLVEAFEPDVVHVHGIHRQISPSILAVAREAGVPVVQTVHDYHHVCPSDVLLVGGDRICEPRKCGSLWYGPCLSNRCVRNSVSASALAAAETGFQRVRRAYERGITRFVSPSRFLAERMVDGGWERTPIDVVPNAVPLGSGSSASGDRDDYFLFAGRLASEKGLDVLLDAANLAGVRLIVAGDGPEGQRLRSIAGPRVEFLGRVEGGVVDDLASRARAVVVPSTWYENAPMSILEAMAMGTAVIASRIGGIPEQITDGVEGLLVGPGDVRGLAAGMEELIREPARAVEMGRAGRARIEHEFSPRAHMDGLLTSYEAARGR